METFDTAQQEPIDSYESESPIINNYITNDHSSVAAGSMVLALIGWGFFAYAALTRSDPSQECKLKNETVQAQVLAQKAQLDFQKSSLQTDSFLRQRVAEACVAKGNIPVFLQGNVDCKVSK